MMERGDLSGATLSVDLDRLLANWRIIQDRLAPGCQAAAVLKANAYGLGVDRVSALLARNGCRRFFVATPEEGIDLARRTPRCEVMVLSGPPPGTEEIFVEHGLIPVLNSPPQIERWAALAKKREKTARCALHVDTGMARLGLSDAEFSAFVADREILSAVAPVLMISHLACADDPDHPMNERQKSAFEKCRAFLPDIPASLSASSGIFLDQASHYQWVRPGAALYGINPAPGRPNPMRPVAKLSAKIIQIRTAMPGETVGYGASFEIRRESRLAIVAAGYADGLFRSLSNRGAGMIGERLAPMVGRVSMDLIVFDVSDIPPYAVHEGASIDLLHDGHDVNALAEEAGTIGYEILTSLGARYRRVYLGGQANG